MQAFLLGIQSFCSKLNTCVHDGIDLVYSILCTIYCNTRPECHFFFFFFVEDALHRLSNGIVACI